MWSVDAIKSGESQKRISVLDYKNAFNTISRELVLKQIDDLCPSLHNWFLWSYGSQPSLFLNEGSYICRSETGVRQGDPLAPLFFAVGLYSITKKIQSLFPDVSIYCYLDDITLVLPEHMEPTVIMDAFDLEHINQSSGLRLNRAKCTVWGPLDIDSFSGFTLLGIPYGTASTKKPGCPCFITFAKFCQ